VRCPNGAYSERRPLCQGSLYTDHLLPDCKAKTLYVESKGKDKCELRLDDELAHVGTFVVEQGDSKKPVRGAQVSIAGEPRAECRVCTSEAGAFYLSKICKQAAGGRASVRCKKGADPTEREFGSKPDKITLSDGTPPSCDITDCPTGAAGWGGNGGTGGANGGGTGGTNGGSGTSGAGGTSGEAGAGGTGGTGGTGGSKGGGGTGGAPCDTICSPNVIDIMKLVLKKKLNVATLSEVVVGPYDCTTGKVTGHWSKNKGVLDTVSIGGKPQCRWPLHFRRDGLCQQQPCQRADRGSNVRSMPLC
jgi:hypothetical protein